MIFKNHVEKMCLLVDVTLPADKTHPPPKAFEKLSKYTDLEIAIDRMWYLKTITIQVATGVSGIMSKQANKYAA